MSAPEISITCIETAQHEKAVSAVLKTLKACQDLPVTRVYWLSNQAMPSAVALEVEKRCPIVWEVISLFNPEQSFNEQYNALTLDRIPALVQSDFNLMIQADGYAVNSSAWTDHFYEYDYIGAVWPKEEDGRNVGNGGFSWRSKKLSKALIDIRSKYSLEEIVSEIRSTDYYQDKFFGQSIPEDNFIAKIYRPKLEAEYGVRFAPPAIADQFSIETNAKSPWLGRSFGFHGHLTGSFYID